MTSTIGPDDPTPNPDGPPTLERMWRRVTLLERDQRALKADIEAELRKLRNDFSATTDSMAHDFEALTAKIELINEELDDLKKLAKKGNETNEASGLLLQAIMRKLDKLVPDE